MPNRRTTSGSVNLPEGVVHVYRDGLQRANPTDATTSAGGEQQAADGLTLAVLAVPAWMNPSDFLTFIAPSADGLQHLRMIRYAHTSVHKLLFIVTY
jgi:BRCA1-associated protein